MRRSAVAGWIAALGIAAAGGCREEAPVEPHEEHQAAESRSPGPPAADVVAIDPESLRDLRVTTAPAKERGGGDGVAALGEVGVNEDAYAEVGPAISARVVEWLASPGERVEAGQPLVVLESSELGKARASHLVARARAVLARKARDRKRELVDDRIAARRELHEAEAELEAAEAELRAAAAELSALGVAPSEFVAEKGGDARFTLRSPLAGNVLERRVAQGRVAEPGQALFRIADLARLWLTVHAYERDAIRVQTGSPARVTFSALPGRTAAGTVVGIGSQVDTSSRTIPIRIDVENPEGALRPGMSATAWLPLGDAGATLVAVPVAALQRTQEGWCVFLPLGEGRFERRKVGRGRDLGDEVEIVSGIQPGESVVVDGAFLLKAEADKAGGEGAQHAH
jgi:cobalt-zinc-cadmium efflux system membrane fusion protein